MITAAKRMLNGNRRLKLHPLSRLADMITLSSGWRRRAIAFVSGAVGVLALPPFDLFPFLIVPMAVAVLLIDGSVSKTVYPSRRRTLFSAAYEAAKTGWWLGFGYFLAGLWWLGAAFLVEADQFAWALPFGVMGLPAVLALFTALGFAASRLIWSHGAIRILALAAGLGAAEYLRSFVFTGFPWNNFGMALGANLVLAQISSIIGLHGLTIVSVALAASPVLLTDRQTRKTPLVLSAAALAGLAAFGYLRLSQNPTTLDDAVKLRILQPNVAQDKKFRAEAMPAILARYLELSSRATEQRPDGIAGVTHLFWPESPFPVILARDADALGRIGDVLAPQTTLITGAARVEVSKDGRQARYFNAIQVVRPGGIIVDSYDKTHLVPFGEYLPFRRAFDALGLRQFVHIPGGFEAGAAKNLIRAPGLPPAAALICYEAIFSGAVLPPGARSLGAAVLINVTNDGWFGDTPGPRQHFAQARLRAIEEGLPLIRAANTGISAIVDPYGRVLQSLPVGMEGLVDGRLPRPAPLTVFSKFPTGAPFTLWLVVLLTIFASSRVQRSRAR